MTVGGLADLTLAALLAAGPTRAAPPNDTAASDIAPGYRPANAEADDVRREAMIPMRDGVKLYTLIVMKTGTAHAPILLERTPYGADGNVGRAGSQHLAQLVPLADAAYVEDGYIRSGRTSGAATALRAPMSPTVRSRGRMCSPT